MGKILNFDLFMSEKKKESITVTVYGKDYEVPMEIPAIVPVMMARAEAAMDATQSVKMVMGAADVLLGENVVDELCRKGMSSNDLAELVQRLFNMIRGVDGEDDEVEEIDDESSKKQTGTGKKSKK